MLIYPPYLDYKKRFITPKINIDKNKFVGTIINRDNKYWKQIYNKIDLLYKNNNKLEKGTFIYRTSKNKNPNNLANSGISDINSPLIYFGLDFVISIWIALEINDKYDKNIPCYLHIYQLNNDIDEYKYIYDNGDIGTILDMEPINSLKIPCIHPQTILHGNVFHYKANELGTELSFPKKLFKLNKNINHIKTFEIDINLLRKNRDKMIFEWDPKKALKN